MRITARTLLTYHPPVTHPPTRRARHPTTRRTALHRRPAGAARTAVAFPGPKGGGGGGTGAKIKIAGGILCGVREYCRSEGWGGGRRAIMADDKSSRAAGP